MFNKDFNQTILEEKGGVIDVCVFGDGVD